MMSPRWKGSYCEQQVYQSRGNKDSVFMQMPLMIKAGEGRRKPGLDWKMLSIVAVFFLEKLLKAVLQTEDLYIGLGLMGVQEIAWFGFPGCPLTCITLQLAGFEQWRWAVQATMWILIPSVHVLNSFLFRIFESYIRKMMSRKLYKFFCLNEVGGYDLKPTCDTGYPLQEMYNME